MLQTAEKAVEFQNSDTFALYWFVSRMPPNAHNIADVIAVIDDYYDDVSDDVGPQHEPNKNTQLCAVTYTYLARLL